MQSTDTKLTHITVDSLAPQKEFESPTFRLGGGRSIQLSYWGVYLLIVPKIKLCVKAVKFQFIEQIHPLDKLK